jgi:hypothetical protein
MIPVRIKYRRGIRVMMEEIVVVEDIDDNNDNINISRINIKQGS